MGLRALGDGGSGVSARSCMVHGSHFVVPSSTSRVVRDFRVRV